MWCGALGEGEAHTHAHTRTHSPTDRHMRTYTLTHGHTCKRRHTHARTNLRTHALTHGHLCIGTHARLAARTHKHTNTRTHERTDARTHECTRTQTREAQAHTQKQLVVLALHARSCRTTLSHQSSPPPPHSHTKAAHPIPPHPGYCFLQPHSPPTGIPCGPRSARPHSTGTHLAGYSPGSQSGRSGRETWLFWPSVGFNRRLGRSGSILYRRPGGAARGRLGTHATPDCRGA